MLIDPDETSYRVVDKYPFADTTQILANTIIVDKEVGVGLGICFVRQSSPNIYIEKLSEMPKPQMHTRSPEIDHPLLFF